MGLVETTKETQVETRVIRTFSTFDIEWENGARWTGFDSADEAVSRMAGASREGRVVERLFTGTFTPRQAQILARPGFTTLERVEIV